MNTDLIPLFQPVTRDALMQKYQLQFPLSDWVSVGFPFAQVKGLDPDLDEALFDEDDVVEYETNRYDVILQDPLTGKTISAYLYMDEDSSKVIAIDNVAQDINTEEKYAIEETPFQPIFQLQQ